MSHVCLRPWFHAATGYMYICTGRRPDGRKNVMPYHRFLMQKHLGRELRSDEHVHHINEDRTDNRIENLEVRLHSDHIRHHWREGGEGRRRRVLGSAWHGTEKKHGVKVSTREERDRARSLFHEGRSIDEVARILERPYNRVWRWIKGKQFAHEREEN